MVYLDPLLSPTAKRNPVRLGLMGLQGLHKLACSANSALCEPMFSSYLGLVSVATSSWENGMSVYI